MLSRLPYSLSKVLGDGMGGPSGLSSSGRAGSGSSLTKDSPDGDRSSRNSFSINPEADIGKLATAGTPKPTVNYSTRTYFFYWNLTSIRF